MANVIRFAVAIAVLALVHACGGSAPTAPSAGPPPVAPTANPTPLPPLPPPPGSTRVFTAIASPLFPAHTWPSSYLLNDDRTFTLQYPHVSYRGTYAEDGTTIIFSWEGWSTAGPWGATGTIDGDTLTVRYNLIMQMSDFEDGVYQRGR